MGSLVPICAPMIGNHPKTKRRIKADLDPMVAEIFDLLAERIETELIPRATRAALLEKAGSLFISRWLDLHPEDQAAVDAIRAKYAGPKKVVRLTPPAPKGERSDPRIIPAKGTEIL